MNKQDRDLLIRIDERSAATATDVAELKRDMKALQNNLDNRYLTRREGRAVNWVIGLAVVMLTIWENFKSVGGN